MQQCGVRGGRGWVAGHAGVVAAEVAGQGADAEHGRELVEGAHQNAVGGRQRALVLEPADLQGRVALAHDALHAHALPQVQVRPEAKRGDLRGHCNSAFTTPLIHWHCLAAIGCCNKCALGREPMASARGPRTLAD